MSSRITMIKGRILYDVTKARKQRQKSGIARVSSCLNKELKALLGDQLVEVVWDDRSRAIKPKGKVDDWRVESRDVFLTCELRVLSRNSRDLRMEYFMTLSHCSILNSRGLIAYRGILAT